MSVERAIFERLGLDDKLRVGLPVDQFLNALDVLPARASYLNLGSARPILPAIEKIYGEVVLEGFARLALHRALCRNWRIHAYAVPVSIATLQEAHSNRILSNLTEKPCGYYRPYSDHFLKDLGVSSSRLLPAGAPVLDINSWLWRKPLRTGSVAERVHFLEVWRRRPFGFGPFYQVHTHTETLNEFTQDGWESSYLRIAELLQMHPEVKGFFRASWFCDPRISEVSPRLAYLVQVPKNNGAYLFDLGIDTSGDALKKSPTRRSMYEAGTYVPRKYMLVWLRRDLLRWADASR